MARIVDGEKRQGNVINVSSACNQNCVFCSGYSKKSTKINEIKRRIDACPTGDVFFQGGEPTLRKELFQLIKHAKAKGHKVTLVTNGLMLSYPEYTKSLFNSGLDYIFFAFHASSRRLNDSLSRNNSSFEMKCRALSNLEKLGMLGSVRIIFVISQANMHDIARFARFIINGYPKINSIEFKLMQGLGNPIANIPQIPKICDFKSELDSAVGLLKKKGINAWTNGMPLCMLKYPDASIETQNLKQGSKIFSGRAYLRKCRKCKKRSMCMGYRRDYAKKFGLI